MGAEVYSHGNPHQVYDGQNVTGTGFFPSILNFSCQLHSTSAPYLKNYHVKQI